MLAGEIKLYENLTLLLRPAATTLNYSIKDIWNDVQQIIIVISYEKLQLNSLVWGSLTPAPIISSAENASTVVEGEVPGAPREWE